MVCSVCKYNGDEFVHIKNTDYCGRFAAMGEYGLTFVELYACPICQTVRMEYTDVEDNT